MRNRMFNCGNPYQGAYKRVLCVCSAGLLRSPTAAVVLAQKPFSYNTRAAGIDAGHALIPVDDVLLTWADEVVCMSASQMEELERRLSKLDRKSTKVICLGISDSFAYRDKVLVKAIRAAYRAQMKPEAPSVEPTAPAAEEKPAA